MYESIARTLKEGGHTANTEPKYLYGAAYEFIQTGRILQAKTTEATVASVRLAMDESLLERFWMINSQFPDKAFKLLPVAFERDKQLFFLQIEGSETGVYLSAQSFLDAFETICFDELRVQLPVAPVLAIKNGEIAAMIMEYSDVPMNFIESREAFSFGNWEKLEKSRKREKSAVTSG